MTPHHLNGEIKTGGQIGRGGLALAQKQGQHRLSGRNGITGGGGVCGRLVAMVGIRTGLGMEGWRDGLGWDG